MIYKILITTVASRYECTSLNTDIIEFDQHSEACQALRQLNKEDAHYSVAYLIVDRKAIPINFSYGEMA